TGYELSARARRPLGYFWSARHSQVYPELRKLLAAGLVRFDTAPGPGPREKKVYSLTHHGMSSLRDWLIQPPEPEPGRANLSPKPTAGRTAATEAAARMFAAEEAKQSERLSEYEAARRRVESRHNGGPPPPRHPDFGNYATLRFGIDYQRQRIAWLRWISRQ